MSKPYWTDGPEGGLVPVFPEPDAGASASPAPRSSNVEADLRTVGVEPGSGAYSIFENLSRSLGGQPSRRPPTGAAPMGSRAAKFLTDLYLQNARQGNSADKHSNAIELLKLNRAWELDDRAASREHTANLMRQAMGDPDPSQSPVGDILKRIPPAPEPVPARPKTPDPYAPSSAAPRPPQGTRVEPPRTPTPADAQPDAPDYRPNPVAATQRSELAEVEKKIRAAQRRSIGMAFVNKDAATATRDYAKDLRAQRSALREKIAKATEASRKKFDEVQNQYTKTRELDRDLSQFETALRTTKDTLGSFTETRADAVTSTRDTGPIGWVVRSVAGMSKEQADAVAKMKALQTRLATTMIAKTKGAVSDKEMQSFQRSMPNLNTSERGNVLIIEGIRAHNRFLKASAELAQKFYSPDGGSDQEGFRRAEADLYRRGGFERDLQEINRRAELIANGENPDAPYGRKPDATETGATKNVIGSKGVSQANLDAGAERARKAISDKPEDRAKIIAAYADCGSACNFDPFEGAIGVQF